MSESVDILVDVLVSTLFRGEGGNPASICPHDDLEEVVFVDERDDGGGPGSEQALQEIWH
jgi:hypothetical protein